VNTQLMRLLDRWLGFLPDYALTLLIKLFQGRPSPSRKGPIVLVKLFGAGSIVLMAQVLQKFDVEPRDIYLVTFKSNATAAGLVGFRNIVFIRRTNVIDLVYDYLKALLRVVSLKPRATIDFEFYSRTTSIFTKLVSLLTGAHSVGFWDADYPRAQGYSSHMPFSYATHVTNLYEAGFASTALERKLLPEITTGRRRDVVRPLVLVNANASDLALGRKWPERNFVDLIVRLTQRFPNVEIGLTGEARESWTTAQILERVQQLVPQALVEDYAGKWDFTTFWDKLQSCLLLVTNDSGPVHFASYLGVSSVSLWGPGSPHQFGPLDKETHVTLWSAFPCSPCMYVRDREHGGFCGQTFPCMPAIPVDSVYSACIEVIERELRTLTLSGSRELPHS